MLKVTVVTPSYNQGNYIEKTILSVLKQDYANIEYIVMDSKSTDTTSEILNKYRSQIAKVVQEKDEGQADAINKGFAISSGEIMAYLNSDDCYAHKSVISHAVQTFNEHPDIDVVFGKRQFIDDDGSFSRNNPYREFDSDTLLHDCFLPQESVFWRRSIYESAGNIVDKSHQFAMDYNLWLRFLRAGGKFMAVNEVYGLFRYYPDQKTHAIWKTIGLPEIAKLQTEFLGHALSETEILAADDKFMFGADPRHESRALAAGQQLWQCFTEHKRQSLKGHPIDQWWSGS
jgi:glycosyltransferase involved in cell wall biosynthesis